VTYTNPLPGRWRPERTDQGVDYAPYSNGQAIVAPANAEVVSTGAPGWPGGGGVTLRFLDGPLAGAHWSVKETLIALVRPGQKVQAGTPIGRAQTGGTGIEILWTDAGGSPLTPYNGKPDGTPMPGGLAMARFLRSLGLPTAQNPGAGPVYPGGPKGSGQTAGGGSGNVNVLGIDTGIPTPQSLIDGLISTVGQYALQIILNIAFVLGGTAMALYGVDRAFGGKPGRQAAELATAAAVVPK
jgi:hypothetical protein